MSKVLFYYTDKDEDLMMRVVQHRDRHRLKQ